MKQTAKRSEGFSLIELLVAMAIGLVVTLAASGILLRSEGAKRSATTSNDINQNAAYLAYSLDRMLRSSGSGYVQQWSNAFGCEIRAAREGATILPPADAWPAPFADLPLGPRLAPVIIHAGASAAGSDVLAVMNGNAGFGETPNSVLPGSVKTDEIKLRNTLGYRGKDLVLLVEPGVGCVLQQVKDGFAGSDSQELPLGGTYAADPVDGVAMSSLGATATLFSVHLGNAVSGTLPQFQYVGVGADNTLFAYDLLQLGVADESLPLAEGVVELRALYGVDTDGDDFIDDWRSPGTTPYTAAEMLDGSAAALARLRGVLAVRVAIVLRSPLAEKDAVAPAKLTLFSDLPVAVQRTVTLTTDQQKSRHRTVEFTVPLRNMLLL